MRCLFLCCLLTLAPHLWALDLFARNQPLREVLPPIAAELGRSVIIDESIDANLTLVLRNVNYQQMLTAVALQLDLLLLWQDDIAVLRPKPAVMPHHEEQMSACQERVWLFKHAKVKAVGALLQQFQPDLAMVVDERTNGIWLRDCAADSRLPELIQWLDSPVKQIEIAAQIAQVRHSQNQQQGARWWLDGVDDKGRGVRLDSDFAGIGSPFNLEALATVDGRELTLALDWLENNGEGEVISRPKIVTSEGQAARIESGTEVPYQVMQEDRTAVEFRQAGLTLEVTPYVKDGDTLLLDLNIHQDAVGELVNGVPSIETNHLSTQVHVADGATLVLGGIYREENLTSESKVPLLGDLPFLGRWFRYQQRHEEKVELVVFITPKLLQKTVN